MLAFPGNTAAALGENAMGHHDLVGLAVTAVA